MHYWSFLFDDYWCFLIDAWWLFSPDANTISDHEVQTGVTIDEIKDYLLSKGMSNYEANTEIELLKTIGNDILFGEHATDSTKKVWMYVTK
ncbi:MAG: hypothetical protein IKL52_07865 [Candidatus Gastranaerophilales bacterium]|nr:hypothetical protein [Candidatus Gastranaerophilales bacterium]MBR6581998.1 hypothetical protein [Treponema sp.]